MNLTLVVPGLHWLDQQDGPDAIRTLRTPALCRLLGAAQIRAMPGSLSQLLAAPYGLKRLPLAQAMALQDGLSATKGTWLFADPVHLRIDRDRALLADSGVMQLSQNDADALITTLNQHFAEEDLQFYAPRPDRWYMQLSRPVSARLCCLPDVIGENIDDYLPDGPDGLRVSRLMNEIQMLLFEHSINQSREAQAEPALNSLWLWGEGGLPTLQRPQATVFSDVPVASMLGLLAGAPVQPMPFSFGCWQAGSANICRIELDTLLGPAQYRDLQGWREAMLLLEEQWFAPVLTALQRGALATLTLLSHGDSGMQATLTARDLWKFWRRPRALTTFY